MRHYHPPAQAAPCGICATPGCRQVVAELQRLHRRHCRAGIRAPERGADAALASRNRC